MFQLRDYQEETINDIYSSMRKGNRTIVVQQPPRTGKTVIMSEIARRATAKGNRVLFVVHRKEIVDQATATFQKQSVDMNLAQLGMVQTITRHVNEIPEPQVIFIDEGHHSLAKTYQRIIDAFPNAIKLLFTATPQRTGKKQLDLIADDIVLGKSIKWLTEHGNLAPFTYYSIDDIDRSKLKKNSTGDFTIESMEQAVKKKYTAMWLRTTRNLPRTSKRLFIATPLEMRLRLRKNSTTMEFQQWKLTGQLIRLSVMKSLKTFAKEKSKY